VSRLKIMAELDIAERRLPQDGRIRVRLQDRLVDIRVSTVPTLHGESVVLRLLDQNRGRISLRDLDMSGDILAGFTAAISRPHGMVLATGPTGSGKTTTLYASIDLIRTGREKILTVEDPIEYQLGVPQVPVNDRIGVTFASALRALLRQDPDVILVGEIRDAETAEIATQAALTGHLVLSSLHTNDAPSALTRLLELGVAPYLAASTVHGVLAQRLVRTNCRECGRPSRMTSEERALFARPVPADAQVVRGAGCSACRGTGYHGRVGIYELLVVSDALREAVSDRRPTADLRRILRQEGMSSLRDDGLRRVLAGSTTPEEVLRVTAAG
jgi:general secretion pathway protein E